MNPEGSLTLGGAIRLRTPDGADQAIASINDAYGCLYAERRSEVLRLIRQMPAFVDVVRTLQKGADYRVVMPPSGGALGRSRVPGLYTANFHGSDGKIIGQAQLERVPPDFISSVNQLANQQAFAEILQRLEALDQRIGDVLTGLHLDRIARVDAGIRLYYQAVVAEDESRPLLLANAITELQKGLETLLAELRNDIRYISELPTSFVGAALSFPAPHDKVDKKIKPMQEAYRAILRSAYFLPVAYESMGNLKSRELCLRQLQDITREFNDDLPTVKCWLAEEDATALVRAWAGGWKIASSAAPGIGQLGSGFHQEVEIEFTPAEITDEA